MEKIVFSIDSLPLGYRFYPTEEELVKHYLKGKNSGQSRSDLENIPVIDICKCEPWDVPAKSIISSDWQWFFFCPKDRKYPNSRRSNRATEAGYWKATGKDRKIESKPDPAVIGTKKTLVFYRGRAPNSVRTNWIIHEYRQPEEGSVEQGGYVLCRLFKKPEERASISDVDGCMEWNPETVQNSILSPSPTMLSPDSDTMGASVEPVAPADQNFAVFQENVQPSPHASDLQTSGENYEPLPDEASNPSNPQVRHFYGTVLSDVAADHESNETTWFNYLKDYLPEPDLDGFHINSPLLTDTGLEFYDVDSVGQKFPPELYQCHSAEADIVTELMNFVCDPDECLHDASNAFSSLWKLDPEDQSFVCPDIPQRDLFSVKETQTGLVEEKDATTSDPRREFSGETCKLPICSSSTQQINYIDPAKQGMDQFSLISDQNLSQDISFVEATTNSSHQVSAEMDDLDSATIKIRIHENLSDSDCIMDQKLGKLWTFNSVKKSLRTAASHDEPASTVKQSASSKMCDDSERNILRWRARCASKDEDLYVLDEVTTHLLHIVLVEPF